MQSLTEKIKNPLRHPLLYLGLTFLVAYLNIVDAVVTYACVQRWGLGVEKNPIAAWMFRQGDIFFLSAKFTFSFVIIAIVCLGYCRVEEYLFESYITRGMILFVTAQYMFLTMLHISNLMIYFNLTL